MERRPERRKHERTAIALKVDYPSQEGFLHDYTANISSGGTMIYTRRQVNEGQELELLLSFPGLIRPIRVNGVVRWVRGEEDGQSSFGVEFYQSSEAGWPALQQLVERIRVGDTAVVAAQTVRVLVAEDNPHVANLIQSGIETHFRRRTDEVAFEINRATNGIEALEQLKAGDFQLLLVDPFLPRIDGIELIRQVRADGRWRDMPIVAVCYEEGDERAGALTAGADFFLTKPLRLASLLATMSRLSLGAAAEGD